MSVHTDQPNLRVSQERRFKSHDTAERRVRARVDMPSRPRTVIDIGLMDRRREHPLRPVPRLGRSQHQGTPACPTQGDPTYLIAAEECAQLPTGSRPEARTLTPVPYKQFRATFSCLRV
jgi:hypothetical protein